MPLDYLASLPRRYVITLYATYEMTPEQDGMLARH